MIGRDLVRTEWKILKNKFEVLIASLSTRENCVCEIYYEDEQQAEISKEKNEIKIQFYANSSQSYWEFPLNQALETLEKAKKIFLEESNGDE